MLALIGNVDVAPIPNRLRGGATAAHARSGTGANIGTELGGRLVARPLPFVDLTLAGAVLLGSAYDTTPWTAIASIDWVVL